MASGKEEVAKAEKEAAGSLQRVKDAEKECSLLRDQLLTAKKPTNSVFIWWSKGSCAIYVAACLASLREVVTATYLLPWLGRVVGTCTVFNACTDDHAI